MVHYYWVSKTIEKMARNFRILNFCLLVLFFLLALGARIGSSQREDTSPIRLENVSFRVREIESTPAPFRMLEVQVEVLNQSQQFVAPPNSIKVVVVPKEVRFSETVSAGKFAPPPGEVTLNAPLPPKARQVFIVGFSLPKEKLESITFEVQINPPEGEMKTVTWEER